MKDVFLLLVFVGCISTCFGLSCIPCDMFNCTTSTCDRSGYALDICGCCDVCSKEYNQLCGGIWGILGTCDQNLTCYYTKEQLATDPSHIFPEGSCVDWHCRTIVDIVIAMTGSASLGEEKFNQLKDAMNILIAKLYEVFGACAHVEVLQFADSDKSVPLKDSEVFRIPFKLGECTNNKDCLKRRMDTMEYLNGTSFVYNALLRIQEVELKKSSRAERSKKVIVAFINGEAEDAENLQAWYVSARAEGIIPFAIGVENYNIQQLRDLANGGVGQDRVKTFSSFTDLGNNVNASLSDDIWRETVIENITCEYPEVYSPCTNSDCENTCEDPYAKCVGDCIDVGCVCGEGYVRRDGANRTCVKVSECPSCVYPKVYTGCTTHCPPTCDNPYPICIESCAPAGCVCAEGYVQKSENDTTCVKQGECPNECEYPKIHRDCTSHCPATCDNPNPICIASCAPAGCVCPEGYVLKNGNDSTCVKREECSIDCKLPLIYNSCPSYCPPTCDEPNPICLTVCAPPACTCPQGLIALEGENGTDCITPKECPAPCTPKNCGIVPLCFAPNCPSYPNAICRSNYCDCTEWYEDAFGRLVDCRSPPIECPYPKVFQLCPSACPATCDNPNPGICTRSDRQCAEDKCVCPPDHVLYSLTDRRCVHAYECPLRDCMKHCSPMNFTGCSSKLGEAWSCHLSNWKCVAYEWKMSMEEWWYTKGCYSEGGSVEYKWQQAFSCPEYIDMHCSNPETKIYSTDAFGCQSVECGTGGYRNPRQLERVWKIYNMKYQELFMLYQEAKMVCGGRQGGGNC